MKLRSSHVLYFVLAIAAAVWLGQRWIGPTGVQGELAKQLRHIERLMSKQPGDTIDAKVTEMSGRFADEFELLLPAARSRIPNSAYPPGWQPPQARSVRQRDELIELFRQYHSEGPEQIEVELRILSVRQLDGGPVADSLVDATSIYIWQGGERRYSDHEQWQMTWVKQEGEWRVRRLLVSES